MDITSLIVDAVSGAVGGNVAGAAMPLTLFGVSDGVHTNDVAVALSVLVGDVSASGFVTGYAAVRGSDANLVQGQSGQAVTQANFRDDVTADGVIDAADVSLVESQSGMVLP